MTHTRTRTPTPTHPHTRTHSDTNTHTRTTTKRPGLALISAVLLATTVPLGLASCSGDAPASAGSADTASGIGAKWGSCMRDAGFAVQDVSDEAASSGTVQRPAGADADAFDRAAADCQQRLGIHGADSAQRQTWHRQYAQVADCIRDHGYADFPEQRPGVIETSGYARASEPHFEEVWGECLHEFAPDTQTQSVG